MFAIFAYQLDLFKKPLALKVQTNFLVSTWLGFLVSLGVFATVALSFFQSNMLSKKNPNVIEKTTTIYPANEQILGKGLLYIFGLLDNNRTLYRDDTIFKIEMSLCNLTGSVPRVYTPLQTINCDYNHVPGIFDGFSNPQNSLCLWDTEVAISGNQNENYFESLQFSLRVCNNATDKVVCKSPLEILNFLKDKVLFAEYPDYTYNIDNFNTPYNKYYKTQLISGLLLSSTRTGISMKKSYFKSDDNFIASGEDQTILSLFDFKEQIVYPISTPAQAITFNTLGNPLSTIYFQSSNNVHYISRRYQKLQEVLANMSGIANTLIIIGMILTALESRMKLLSIIITNLYTFVPKRRSGGNGAEKEKETIIKNNGDQDRDQDHYQNDINRNMNKVKLKEPALLEHELPILKPKSNEITNPIKANEINVQVQVQEDRPNVNSKIKPKYFVDDNPIQISLDNLSENDEPKIKYTKSKKLQAEHEKVQNFENFYQKAKKSKNVNITTRNYLFAKIKKQFRKKMTDNEKMILQAEEIFEKEIDFVTILEKLQEIEKLKFLLLSPTQLSLFNLLGKPTLYLDVDEDKKNNSMVKLL